jgi:hypothetical protein
MTIAKDMWDALVYKFEENVQIKQTKLTGLETRFKIFDIRDNESIDDMYNRMMQIQNEFVELREPISNNKVVGKILRVMLIRTKVCYKVSVQQAVPFKPRFYF